jgi:hypothetical protein
MFIPQFGAGLAFGYTKGFGDVEVQSFGFGVSVRGHF